MKKKIYENIDKNSFHLRIKKWFGFVFLLFSYALSAQLYIGKNTFISVHDKSFIHADTILFEKNRVSSPKEQAKIYITKGATVYNLAEHTQSKLVYIDVEKNTGSRKEKATSSFPSKSSAGNKIKTENSAKRKAQFVYKPFSETTRFHLSTGSENPAVVSGSSFFGKNTGALSGFEVLTTLKHYISRNRKIFSNDEGFITFLISYKAERAPPVPLF